MEHSQLDNVEALWVLNPLVFLGLDEEAVRLTATSYYIHPYSLRPDTSWELLLSHLERAYEQACWHDDHTDITAVLNGGSGGRAAVHVGPTPRALLEALFPRFDGQTQDGIEHCLVVPREGVAMRAVKRTG